MERSHFLAALQSPKALQTQSKKEWDALATKYPFAASIQLLRFQKKESLTASEKRKLLLHFDHPLHLALQLAKGKEAVEVKQEVVEESANAKKMRLGAAGKLAEKAAVAKEEVEEATPDKTVEVQPIVEESKSSKVVENKSNIQVDTEPMQPKESTTEDKDVLQLIKELPEENPISASTKVEEVQQKEAIAEKEEDPGDLMVMMSFTDWLQYFKAKKENEAEDKKGRDAIRSAWQKEKLAEAMDDEEDVVPDEIFEKAMKSVSFGDGLVTEPLAELYVQQGKTEKAIELYKKLSLLNPEKSTYFASRIKDLHLLK